ncbi:MAG: hypothetical protein KDD52_08860 [Bdellovibrionales bacterium]|nr:hypothetical protein [Bdellovibrionales bacterium]
MRFYVGCVMLMSLFWGFAGKLWAQGDLPYAVTVTRLIEPIQNQIINYTYHSDHGEQRLDQCNTHYKENKMADRLIEYYFLDEGVSMSSTPNFFAFAETKADKTYKRKTYTWDLQFDGSSLDILFILDNTAKFESLDLGQLCRGEDVDPEKVEGSMGVFVMGTNNAALVPNAKAEVKYAIQAHCFLPLHYRMFDLTNVQNSIEEPFQAMKKATSMGKVYSGFVKEIQELESRLPHNQEEFESFRKSLDDQEYAIKVLQKILDKDSYADEAQRILFQVFWIYARTQNTIETWKAFLNFCRELSTDLRHEYRSVIQDLEDYVLLI